MAWRWIGVLALVGQHLPAQVPAPPTSSYLFFVASEAIDQVALVRFGPKGALIEHRTPVRLNPDEAAGPLELSVSPDHDFYYVLVARGFVNGELLKVRIAADSSLRESHPADTVRGREPLAARPAAVDVTPDAAYAWVTAGGGGDSTGGSVSVVYLPQMVEVARIPTCGEPGGSRLAANGSRHYSVCGADDLLIEIDAHAMRVTRRLPLAGTTPCGPTWAEPSGDGSRIFVACHRSNEVVEIDAATGSVARRIPMGDGIYRLALTHDGRLLIGTDQRGRSVSIVDLAGGREPARLPTTQDGPAGVIVSPDDRYAFVAVSGSASESGLVEIIDLVALKVVATIDVGRGPRGIAFWKMQSRQP